MVGSSGDKSIAVTVPTINGNFCVAARHVVGGTESSTSFYTIISQQLREDILTT